MSKNVVSLPTLPTLDVCSPFCPQQDRKLIAAKLCEGFQTGGRPAAAGNYAVIDTQTEPGQGEAGAIKYKGQYVVGRVEYTGAGGVFITTDAGSRPFTRGTYEMVGRVERVCVSCAQRECFPVPGPNAEVIERPVYVAR